MTRGKFIVVEGIDGAGKSTHLPLICSEIQARFQVNTVLTREPGGSDLGEAIRTLLLHQPMDGETEVLLAFAARRDHLSRVIAPALARGDWVVCDRFTDSTRAYQGGGRGVSMDLLSALRQPCMQGLNPIAYSFLMRVLSLPIREEPFGPRMGTVLNKWTRHSSPGSERSTFKELKCFLRCMR